MPKKRKNDLSDFQEWLINDQALGRRTASVYASTVRKILGAMPQITTGELDRYLQAIESRPAKDNAYTAWRKFVSYFKFRGIKTAEGYATLPEPTERSRKAPEATYDIPNYILYCVSNIRRECRFPWEAFCLLKHSDCVKVRRASFYDITHPEEKWNSYRISSEYIDPILKWGDPLQDHPTLPFLPVAPMSYEPLPTAHLKKLMRGYRRQKNHQNDG